MSWNGFTNILWIEEFRKDLFYYRHPHTVKPDSLQLKNQFLKIDTVNLPYFFLENANAIWRTHLRNNHLEDCTKQLGRSWRDEEGSRVLNTELVCESLELLIFEYDTAWEIWFCSRQVLTGGGVEDQTLGENKSK